MASNPADPACPTFFFRKNVDKNDKNVEERHTHCRFGLPRFRQSSVSTSRAEVSDGPVLSWIKSYFSGQSYQVLIDSVPFEEVPYLSGVLPGSVIGPLLFLLHINDLPTALDDSAFRFANYVQMVFLRSRSSLLLASLSSAWTWVG